MSNLMVYPAEIAEMSVNQLAALPHAKLVEATTNLDELLKWAKENRQKLDAAMEMRFGGQGRGALNESGRDFGTVHFNDGPLSVSYDLPKRVSWDQTKLKAIAERIVAAGEPLAEAMTETSFVWQSSPTAKSTPPSWVCQARSSLVEVAARVHQRQRLPLHTRRQPTWPQLVPQ